MDNPQTYLLADDLVGQTDQVIPAPLTSALETGPCGRSGWPGQRASKVEGLGCCVPFPAGPMARMFSIIRHSAHSYSWKERSPVFPEAEFEQLARAAHRNRVHFQARRNCLQSPGLFLQLHTEPWALHGLATQLSTVTEWPANQTFRPVCPTGQALGDRPQSLVVGCVQEAGCWAR